MYERFRLLGFLIINTAIPPIPLYTYMPSSLRKYTASMMSVILKIVYGAEKSIGSLNNLKI